MCELDQISLTRDVRECALSNLGFKKLWGSQLRKTLQTQQSARAQSVAPAGFRSSDYKSDLP